MTYSIQVLTVIFLSYPNKLHLNKIRYIECLRDLYRVIVIIKKKRKRKDITLVVETGQLLLLAYGNPTLLYLVYEYPILKKCVTS